MTVHGGTVAAPKQALSVRFDTAGTSLASCAGAPSWHAGQSAHSAAPALLLSPPKWVTVAPSNNERQLSWRGNRKPHIPPLSCHFGGCEYFTRGRCSVARRLDVNFPLPSTTSRHKLTFPFRSRMNIADADMLGGEEWENPSEEEKKNYMGHSSELILAPIILSFLSTPSLSSAAALKVQETTVPRWRVKLSVLMSIPLPVSIFLGLESILWLTNSSLLYLNLLEGLYRCVFRHLFWLQNFFS